MSERRARRRPRKPAIHVGAGLISGASDNDPTTVATLAVVGSTTGYALGWLVLLVIPMLAVVQSVAAALGAVSHKGLEDCIRFRFGRAWALVALVLVLAVNLVTLAADLEGGGAALALLTHVDYRWWIVPLAGSAAALLVFANYEAIANVLKYVTLVFFAYVGAAVLSRPDWAAVARGSLVPHLENSRAFVDGTIALLGTTLTSYAYVWETVETSEERPPLRRLGLVQVDAVAGIAVAGLVFWCILVATAATLGVHHTTVQTADDAARALAPIAGRYASVVFGFGLLGSALIAVPVLAGTSAYVLAEMFGWRSSLDATFYGAPQFYASLLISLGASAGIAFAGASPITLLFWSGIAGGIATPVTLALMMLLARDRRVMGKHRIGAGLEIVGWAVTALVTAAAAVYLVRTAVGGS